MVGGGLPGLAIGCSPSPIQATPLLHWSIRHRITRPWVILRLVNCNLVYCHPLNNALVHSARQFLVFLWRREDFKQRPHVSSLRSSINLNSLGMNDSRRGKKSQQPLKIFSQWLFRYSIELYWITNGGLGKLFTSRALVVHRWTKIWNMFSFIFHIISNMSLIVSQCWSGTEHTIHIQCNVGVGDVHR